MFDGAVRDYSVPICKVHFLVCFVGWLGAENVFVYCIYPDGERDDSVKYANIGGTKASHMHIEVRIVEAAECILLRVVSCDGYGLVWVAAIWNLVKTAMRGKGTQ